MTGRKAAGRRAAYLALILLGISLVTFGLGRLIPGDPAEILLRERIENPSAKQVAELRRELGLERPFFYQYGAWLHRTLSGDLGRSWRTGQPVTREIAAALPATLELALLAFGLIVCLSTALGLISAARRNRWVDRVSRGWAVLLLSLPNFWLASLLIYFFSLKLGWLPVAGREGFRHLILPVLTLALPAAAFQGRVLRSGVLEILGQEYIRFARAKGLPPAAIFRHHVLKNALPAVASLWALSLGHLLGGSFIVESIFAWPGLGRLTVEAVLNRDLPLLQGTVLLMTLFYVLVNQGLEWFLGVIDPRVRSSPRD
jgi:ABC-type dipeptide/oligopeptide/nickel transport system permease component